MSDLYPYSEIWNNDSKLLILRILFISRHYPPYVSGGSRRAYELVKGLRATGEDVTVVAPHEGDDPNIIGVFHPQPEASTKPAKASWKDGLRLHLLYPDPDIMWSLRVVKKVKQTYPQGFDYIITSSPPESVHVAGFLLKRAWGCRWLADFRDSWLAVPLLPVRNNRSRQWIEKRIAKFLLSKTDIRTATLQAYADEIKNLSGLEAHVLPNFADPASDVDPNYSLDPNSIHVMHTGSFSLSDPDRSILPLLNVYTQARQKNMSLHLHLIGRLTDAEIDMVQKSPMSSHISVAGTFSYAQTRSIQNQAHALLVTAAPDAIAVPGKIEEYKSTHRPIIAIGSGPWRASLNTADPVNQLASLTQEKEHVSYELSQSKTAIELLKGFMDEG